MFIFTEQVKMIQYLQHTTHTNTTYKAAKAAEQFRHLFMSSETYKYDIYVCTAGLYRQTTERENPVKRFMCLVMGNLKREQVHAC